MKTAPRLAKLFGIAIADLALAGLLLVAAPAFAAESTSAADVAQVRKLLTDTALWGQDAFAFFATLQRWKDAGEKSVLVYPDRVVAGRKHETAGSAGEAARPLSAAVVAKEIKLRPDFRSVYQASLARASSFQVQAQRFAEDDSFRLMVQRPDGEFLKPGITMQAVEERYGKPEKSTTELVEGLGDRRPVILTVHSYASGAVKFILSDHSLTPNVVHRVALDVDAAAAQLF